MASALYISGHSEAFGWGGNGKVLDSILLNLLSIHSGLSPAHRADYLCSALSILAHPLNIAPNIISAFQLYY